MGPGVHAHGGDRPARKPDRLLPAPWLRPHPHPPAVPLRRRALRHPAARGPAPGVAGKAPAHGTDRMNAPTWTFVCTSAELLPGEMRPVLDEVTGTAILVVNLD